MIAAAPVQPNAATDPLDRWLDPAEVHATLVPVLARRAADAAIPDLLSGELAIGDVHLKTYARPESAAKEWLGVVYRFGPAGRTLVHARFHRNRDALRGAAGDGGLDPRWAARIWMFPDDPAMADLAAAVVPARLAPRLRAFDPSLPPIGAVEAIHYRPGIRCTTRVAAAEDVAGEATLYGKTYAEACAPTIASRYVALVRAGAPQVPALLGCARDGRSFWTHAATGPTLASRVAGALSPQAVQVHLERAAASLARLHRVRAPIECATVTRAILADEAAKKLARLAARFARSAPDLAPLAARVEAHLRRGAQGASAAPALIHGDCHAGQWIAADDRVTLLDLDELARGEAEQDLANFEVDLGARGATAADVERIKRSFHAAYADAADRPIDRAALAWHAAIQRVNKIHRQFVQRRWRGAEAVERALETLALELERAH